MRIGRFLGTFGIALPLLGAIVADPMRFPTYLELIGFSGLVFVLLQLRRP